MKLAPTYNGFLCPDDPGEPGTGQKRWSVNQIEARIVSELCRGLNVLEIGTGLGVSTREIANRANHVYTVDVDPWVRENVELPRNATLFDNIQDVPRGLEAAFIDGFHEYKQCKRDIKDACKILKPDSPIIFHDMKISGVFRAVKDSGLLAVYIETYAGMALAWSKK